ncbi:MAG: hypothetical protein ABI592_01130 [Acidobacteriota bacterium]
MTRLDEVQVSLLRAATVLAQRGKTDSDESRAIVAVAALGSAADDLRQVAGAAFDDVEGFRRTVDRLIHNLPLELKVRLLFLLIDIAGDGGMPIAFTEDEVRRMHGS